MIINLKSQTDLSGFYIVYKGSTNLETKGIRGISHVSEHLMCKAFDHLQDEFERKGISWNAYTDSNSIVFYFTGLSEYLSPYRKVVLDLLQSFRPTEQHFLDEVRIVVEEYKDYFANQSYSHFLNLSRKLFDDYDAIGSLKDLESLTYNDIISFIEKQYAGPSKIINVSKDNDFNEDVKFISRLVDRNLEYGVYPFEEELGNSFKDKSSVIILSPVFSGDEGSVDFICDMISNGLQSPLYKEVREKRGLSYGVSCSRSNVGNSSLVGIHVSTSNDKVDELIQTLKDTLNDPNILTQERFDITKERLTVNRKKSAINRHNNVSKWIDDSESVDDILDTTTLEELKEIYPKYFTFDKMYVSVDKKEFDINESVTDYEESVC